MGHGSSKSSSKVSRRKSEATIQTDVTIAPTYLQDPSKSTNPLSTPENRIRLADPRSASAGIIRTPILVEDSEVSVVTNRPRYLETNLDEVLPYYSDALQHGLQNTNSIPVSHHGKGCYPKDGSAEDVNDACSVSKVPSKELSSVDAKPDLETSQESLENEKIDKELFDKVVIDCEGVIENHDDTSFEEGNNKVNSEANKNCENFMSISLVKIQEDKIILADELPGENIYPEDPKQIDEMSSDRERKVAYSTSTDNIYTKITEKNEQDCGDEFQTNVSCPECSTTCSTQASNGSRCFGECSCKEGSWCQCDAATAVMLSSLRAIGLKEPGEPTLPLPPLPDSLSANIFDKSRIDWFGEDCDESELFVDEETKAVAQQLLALSQSVGAYSRQLLSSDKEVQYIINVKHENVEGKFNNMVPPRQRNEGIMLTHYNLPKTSPGPAVYEDPPCEIYEMSKGCNNAVKRLHFTPEQLDSEKVFSLQTS